MEEQGKVGILLETGTNELELLELFINERDPDGGPTVPCHFGVNVAKVMQVIEDPRLTPPEAAVNPCYLGLISLRGLSIPVLDLAVWLGMDREPSDFDVVIVTEFSETVTGFLVSGVTNIYRVGWGQVAPPHRFISGAGTASIIGMVEMEERFIQLLDLEKVLADLDPESFEHKTEADGVRANQQYTAVVADDSPTIRLILRKNLEAANFNLVMTENGEQALAAVRELGAKAEKEGRPVRDILQIVIADIEMPLMDGFSLTKAIKSDPALKGLPVILYSSIITKELRHKGESVGADDQVSKPDMSDMAQRAITLIEKGKVAA